MWKWNSINQKDKKTLTNRNKVLVQWKPRDCTYWINKKGKHTITKTQKLSKSEWKQIQRPTYEI